MPRVGGLSRARVHLALLQFKTVKPVGDRVFVKVDKEEVKSIGGVLLPSGSTKNSTAGTIVSLGDAKSVKVRSSSWAAAQRSAVTRGSPHRPAQWPYGVPSSPCPMPALLSPCCADW